MKLLVKTLFEEVSFMASFEGREGRAVTDSERKRIPDFTVHLAAGQSGRQTAVMDPSGRLVLRWALHGK